MFQIASLKRPELSLARNSCGPQRPRISTAKAVALAKVGIFELLDILFFFCTAIVMGRYLLSEGGSGRRNIVAGDGHSDCNTCSFSKESGATGSFEKGN